MEITIEQLKNTTPEARETINDLLSQLNPDSRILSEDELIKIVGESANYVLVAREPSGKIVGMLTLIVVNALFVRKGLLEEIVVDKKYRGKGIGSKLINEVISIARNEKISYIDFTSVPAKVAANLFYQQLGFEKRNTNVYRINL